MRIGHAARFRDRRARPSCASHPFPPILLISLVENAIKHGIEPSADGGRVDDRARAATATAVVVTVSDTGRGLGGTSPAQGGGVGLTNVRERLAALYGARGRFTLRADDRRAARAPRSRCPFEPGT